MGKDPAFLFYPDDWMGGTQAYTLEEKGAYMTLLCEQFNRSILTDNIIKRLLGSRYKIVWTVIKEKFKKNAHGYYNERLREEKLKRQRYCESRADNRRNK